MMEPASSIAIAVVGPSGAGRTTIVRALLNGGYGFRLISSNTTRSRRASDLIGEYRYLTEDAFHCKAAAGDFLWTVSLHNV